MCTGERHAQAVFTTRYPAGTLMRVMWTDDEKEGQVTERQEVTYVAAALIDLRGCMLEAYDRRQIMDSTGHVEPDPYMQERDAELARLVARVEQIRGELALAEAELRAYQLQDMEARRQREKPRAAGGRPGTGHRRSSWPHRRAHDVTVVAGLPCASR